jgi:diguanylate cyclase (GGDEF)-like protein
VRRTPLLALMVGVVLLAVGVLVTAGAFAQQREQRRTSQRDADQVASAFSAYFERARSLDLLLAENQAFDLTARGGVDRDAANRALRYLEVLYPGAIGEACLIDQQGREFARVTEGRPAPVAELSSNEAQNPFFAPTLALGPGQVYQAPPYVSPDTKRWVISNSTWIRLSDGARMIVHFEVSLDSFVRYAATSVATRHLAIVDRNTGQIFLQDHAPLPAPTPLRLFPSTGWSEAFTAVSAQGGATEVNGYPAMFRRIDRTAGNANDWYVVEWSTTRGSLPPVWAGAAGTVLGVLLIFLALLVFRRQQGTLRAAARLDHLTGLANRKALEEALEEAVQAAGRPGGDRVAVLMLDLDGFKQVNDALGHDKGDLVLQEIARRLHANVFDYDTAARLGGDEFAVILRRMQGTDDVASVAHRLREALIRPIDIDGIPRFVGASVGVAVYLDHGRSAAELVRNADAAMYHAKRAREGVRVYDAGTPAGATALGLAAELMIAIDNEELQLAFQPEFSLTTGQIVGVEALARWERSGKFVPPAEFIPLAEDTGLIRSLTYLTLRRALDEAQTWWTNGVHVPVSVNLSGKMASDSTLPEQVTGLLEQRGLPGNALVLEITETAAISDRDRAVDVLQHLRATGIRVELDDFGSGHASFGALHDLPLDGVKIDRELIADQQHGGPRLLAATIEIAQRLGLNIVAEGIEDAATLDTVRQLGCHTAQGYHLARPMTPDALHRLIDREHRTAALQGDHA